MTKNDDTLIKSFLQDRKIEIEDKNFTKHVMRRLPDRERKLSKIWTYFCITVGALCFLISGGMGILIDIARKIPTWNIMISIKQTDPIALGIVILILITLGVRRICSIE